MTLKVMGTGSPTARTPFTIGILTHIPWMNPSSLCNAWSVVNQSFRAMACAVGHTQTVRLSIEKPALSGVRYAQNCDVEPIRANMHAERQTAHRLCWSAGDVMTKTTLSMGSSNHMARHAADIILGDVPLSMSKPACSARTIGTLPVHVNVTSSGATSLSGIRFGNVSAIVVDLCSRQIKRDGVYERSLAPPKAECAMSFATPVVNLVMRRLETVSNVRRWTAMTSPS